MKIRYLSFLLCLSACGSVTAIQPDGGCGSKCVEATAGTGSVGGQAGGMAGVGGQASAGGNSGKAGSTAGFSGQAGGNSGNLDAGTGGQAAVDGSTACPGGTCDCPLPRMKSIQGGLVICGCPADEQFYPAVDGGLDVCSYPPPISNTLCPDGGAPSIVDGGLECINPCGQNSVQVYANGYWSCSCATGFSYVLGLNDMFSCQPSK